MGEVENRRLAQKLVSSPAPLDEYTNAIAQAITDAEKRGQDRSSFEHVALEVLKGLLANTAIVSYENAVGLNYGSSRREIAVGAVEIARHFFAELKRG